VAKHLYLRKANDHLVSHCPCAKADALITVPSQMDCPWSGCGWLFMSNHCRKAFTFAEAVEVKESWEETADRAIRGLFQRGPEPGQVEEWVGFMKILLKGIRPGEEYVYLDGWVIPTRAKFVRIEGWHSRHDLEFVPQQAALKDLGVRTGLLSANQYWLSTAIEQESG
jgi:hypothetical protein